MDLKDCKPCPFCGGRSFRWETVAHVYGGYNTVAVACNHVPCDAVGPRSLTQSEAVAKWNRRAEEEAK